MMDAFILSLVGYRVRIKCGIATIDGILQSTKVRVAPFNNTYWLMERWGDGCMAQVQFDANRVDSLNLQVGTKDSVLAEITVKAYPYK